MKHCLMKTRGVVVHNHVLTAAVVGGEWLPSRSGQFTTRIKVIFTHLTRGGDYPRARLESMEELKFFTLPGLELRPLVHAVSTIQSLF
jgi:hypothetical protein